MLKLLVWTTEEQPAPEGGLPPPLGTFDTLRQCSLFQAIGRGGIFFLIVYFEIFELHFSHEKTWACQGEGRVSLGHLDGRYDTGAQGFTAQVDLSLKVMLSSWANVLILKTATL